MNIKSMVLHIQKHENAVMVSAINEYSLLRFGSFESYCLKLFPKRAQ